MSEESNKPVLFKDDSMAIMAQNDAAAVARATQEIQAALTIAQRFERNEIKAKTRILEACKRKELAEVAEYEYSRGGTRITGPTIDLLRAIANRWGNIRYGWSEVERREGYSMVRCFAWDLQSNGQAERTFSVKHWRDTSAGGYALEDERDIYELMANQAARRVRACLEEVIDADVVDAAVEQCRLTLKTDQRTPMSDRLVKIMESFKPFGVTQSMVETRLGNKLEAVSENQYAQLFRIWKSLKDGVGKREDYFKPPTAKPEFAGEAKAAPTQSETAGTSSAPVQSTDVSGGSPPAKSSYLTAIRNLCSVAKFTEATLLGYLQQTGASDGSHASLDEVPAEILGSVHDHWKDVVAAIRQGGGAK